LRHGNVVHLFSKGQTMKIYKDIYEFAASAGAFEGYVYQGGKADASYLPRWVDHLVERYQKLPREVQEEIQPQCDGTLGRAIRSLVPVLGDNNDVIQRLRVLVKGELPSSPDDFSR